jgi:hypothetical protein
MIEKTIIAVYGRQNEGKTSTIIRTYQKLISDFVNRTIIEEIISNEIFAVIEIGNIKIGFESTGDPKSRIITENTLEKLSANIDSNHFDLRISDCNIIICASRTSGGTVNEIDRIASTFGYRTIWKSSYYAPNFNHDVVNRIASEEIVNLIKSIITTEL